MARAKKAKAAKTIDSFDGFGLASDILLPYEEMMWLPSKSPVINYNLGGGIPYGKMVEFLGEESSGKTLLAMDFIRSAQLLGGTGVFIDAEFSFDQRWAEVNGLDLDNIYIYQEAAVEKISDVMKTAALKLRSEFVNNEPIVMVVDSLAALDTLEAMESDQMDSKAEMGTRAKAVYRMIRTRNRLLSRLGIITIFINQLRDKVGANAMFADTETSPGGKAMKYFAAQRISLYTLAQITDGTGDNKRRVGNNISFRIKKNKVAPPRSPYKTHVIFDEEYGETGFSRYIGLAPILFDLGVIEKKGNAIYFDGDHIARGKDHFDEVIAEDKDLRADLLEEAGINTIKQAQIKLDSIPDNMYEV